MGGDVNTDDFVGPDNAGYVGRSTENCEHARLALEAQNSEHAVSFCQNQRESSLSLLKLSALLM